MFPPMRADNIYSGKGSAVHDALEKYVNAILRKNGADIDEDKCEIDWERTLIDYYSTSGLWKLDVRKPEKGHPHPVEKTCETCPWASKDDRCKIARKAISAVEGCPRPNFQEDYDLVKKTLERTDYNPLELDEDGAFKQKILGVEIGFDMELEGVPVRGYMDLVVEEDESTLEVIDYKTGRSMSYDKAAKDPQVRIYGAVARKLWPQYDTILVTLHYLKKRPVTVPLGPSEDEKTFQSLIRAYNNIIEDEDPRRIKNWLCPYCVGYDECGKLKRKLKERGRFKLPTIECAYREEDGDCWGSIYPIKKQPKEVTLESALEIVYACKGHADLHDGGQYIPEEVDSDEDIEDEVDDSDSSS